MYNILTFDNGQPFILYQEGKKIYMYTIARGRITAKGLLFNDVEDNLHVFQCTPAKIYYISTDNRLKIYSLSNQHFTEVISMPLKSDAFIIRQLSPVLFNNILYVFFLNTSLKDDTTNLYYISCFGSNSSASVASMSGASGTSTSGVSGTFTPTGSVLLKENIDPSDIICTFWANNKIFLSFENKTTTHFYYFDENKNLINVNSEPKSIIEATSIPDEEINSEISRLNDSLNELSAQYNELSEYAGTLQEELRKARYTFV